MALKLIFNAISVKFDYVDISGVTPTPQIVASGVSFTVSDNTQVCYANPIIIQAGGSVLTVGTAALTYVN